MELKNEMEIALTVIYFVLCMYDRDAGSLSCKQVHTKHFLQLECLNQIQAVYLYNSSGPSLHIVFHSY